MMELYVWGKTEILGSWSRYHLCEDIEEAQAILNNITTDYKYELLTWSKNR